MLQQKLFPLLNTHIQIHIEKFLHQLPKPVLWMAVEKPVLPRLHRWKRPQNQNLGILIVKRFQRMNNRLVISFHKPSYHLNYITRFSLKNKTIAIMQTINSPTGYAAHTPVIAKILDKIKAVGIIITNPLANEITCDLVDLSVDVK